ncbi:unnamed protein product [Cyprideis torosa]|uniref:Uncharacterized protein n=1 Tax=Cyprideis torosa TaxID=163714 RepID=A0A7R8W0M7_9CRUS|nr:unnamed protein product [Cyprideis torosa]CAG0879938.1 unnamed protein product [Cyprideis torosa]
MSEEMTEASLMKLKVVDLRAMLQERGLDTKGVKQVLVNRLLDSQGENEAEEEGEDEKEAEEEESILGGDDAGKVDSSKELEAEAPTQVNHAAPEESVAATNHAIEKDEAMPESKSEDETPAGRGTKRKADDVSSESVPEKEPRLSESVKKEKEEAPTVEVKPEEKSEDVKPEVKPEEGKSEDVKPEGKSEGTEDYEEGAESKKENETAVKTETQKKTQGTTVSEDEPDLPEDKVILDWYDSDLHLVIDKTSFLSCQPLTGGGFAYVWAGARGSYGFERGKVFFEAKIVENLAVEEGTEKEPHPNVARVGWSVNSCSLQLGEEPLSYGYGGTGKASENCKFKNYGIPFAVGDTVGAYLDMDSEDSVTMSFTVNGADQGTAFTISKSSVKGQPLFPHVLMKNCSLQVQFEGTPWYPASGNLASYTFCGDIPLENRIRGVVRPTERKDCEAIMMCGLPGAGKTTWISQYVPAHPEKRYNVLGTNALLDKMKVMGLPRKKNYHGRWDLLIQKTTVCFNVILQRAYVRRRNYIIDQTNVYPSARRRKMDKFLGMKRRAVVIVCNEEEQKRREGKRKEAEGDDIPQSATLDMKANFKLPSTEEVFDEVDFVELGEEEAKVEVAKYNEEAKAAGVHSRAEMEANKRWQRTGGQNFGGSHRGGHGMQQGIPSVGGRRDRGDFRGGRGGSWRGGGGSWRGQQGGYGNKPNYYGSPHWSQAQSPWGYQQQYPQRSHAPPQVWQGYGNGYGGYSTPRQAWGGQQQAYGYGAQTGGYYAQQQTQGYYGRGCALETFPIEESLLHGQQLLPRAMGYLPGEEDMEADIESKIILLPSPVPISTEVSLIFTVTVETSIKERRWSTWKDGS